MKTKAVIKMIREAANAAGVEFELFERKGHTGIRVGSKKTTIGRHTETTDDMAEKIYRQLQDELGQGWWRK